MPSQAGQASLAGLGFAAPDSMKTIYAGRTSIYAPLTVKIVSGALSMAGANAGPGAPKAAPQPGKLGAPAKKGPAKPRTKGTDGVSPARPKKKTKSKKKNPVESGEITSSPSAVDLGVDEVRGEDDVSDSTTFFQSTEINLIAVGLYILSAIATIILFGICAGLLFVNVNFQVSINFFSWGFAAPVLWSPTAILQQSNTWIKAFGFVFALSVWIRFAPELYLIRRRYSRLYIEGRKVRCFIDWKIFFSFWFAHTFLDIVTLTMWSLFGFRDKMMGEYIDENLCWEDELDIRDQPTSDRQRWVVERARTKVKSSLSYRILGPLTLWIYEYFMHPQYWKDYFEVAEFGGRRYAYVADIAEHKKMWLQRGMLNRWTFGLWSAILRALGKSTVESYYDENINFETMLRYPGFVEEIEKKKSKKKKQAKKAKDFIKKNIASTATKPLIADDEATVRVDREPEKQHVYFSADAPIPLKAGLFALYIIVMTFSEVFGMFITTISFFTVPAAATFMQMVILKRKFNNMVICGRKVRFFGRWGDLAMLLYTARIINWCTLGFWKLPIFYLLPGGGYDMLWIDDHLCFDDEYEQVIAEGGKRGRRWRCVNVRPGRQTWVVNWCWQKIKKYGNVLTLRYFEYWIFPWYYEKAFTTLRFGGHVLAYHTSPEYFEKMYMIKRYYWLWDMLTFGLYSFFGGGGEIDEIQDRNLRYVGHVDDSTDLLLWGATKKARAKAMERKEKLDEIAAEEARLQEEEKKRKKEERERKRKAKIEKMFKKKGIKVDTGTINKTRRTVKSLAKVEEEEEVSAAELRKLQIEMEPPEGTRWVLNEETYIWEVQPLEDDPNFGAEKDFVGCVRKTMSMRFYLYGSLACVWLFYVLPGIGITLAAVSAILKKQKAFPLHVVAAIYGLASWGLCALAGLVFGFFGLLAATLLTTPPAVLVGLGICGVQFLEERSRMKREGNDSSSEGETPHSMDGHRKVAPDPRFDATNKPAKIFSPPPSGVSSNRKPNGSVRSTRSVDSANSGSGKGGTRNISGDALNKDGDGDSGGRRANLSSRGESRRPLVANLKAV